MQECATRGGTVRVLVVGTEGWAVEQAASVLERDGCVVLRCHQPGDSAFPCNALRPGRTCPLDAGFDVVTTVRARPLASLAEREFGVVCALHAGAPLVVAGVGAGHPLRQWTSVLVDQGGDLGSAVRAAVRAGEGEKGPEQEERVSQPVVSRSP